MSGDDGVLVSARVRAGRGVGSRARSSSSPPSWPQAQADDVLRISSRCRAAAVAMSAELKQDDTGSAIVPVLACVLNQLCLRNDRVSTRAAARSSQLYDEKSSTSENRMSTVPIALEVRVFTPELYSPHLLRALPQLPMSQKGLSKGLLEATGQSDATAPVRDIAPSGQDQVRRSGGRSQSVISSESLSVCNFMTNLLRATPRSLLPFGLGLCVLVLLSLPLPGSAAAVSRLGSSRGCVGRGRCGASSLSMEWMRRRALRCRTGRSLRRRMRRSRTADERRSAERKRRSTRSRCSNTEVSMRQRWNSVAHLDITVAVVARLLLVLRAIEHR